MDRYVLTTEIGKGASGTVFFATDNKTGEMVAVKKIFYKCNSTIPSEALREPSFLNIFYHKNVIRLKDQMGDDHHLRLVFELMGEGSLHDFMEDKDDKGTKNLIMDLGLVKSFLRQILLGLQHIHGHGVVHRDLTPLNILVHADRQTVKIADFGLS